MKSNMICYEMHCEWKIINQKKRGKKSQLPTADEYRKGRGHQGDGEA